MGAACDRISPVTTEEGHTHTPHTPVGSSLACGWRRRGEETGAMADDSLALVDPRAAAGVALVPWDKPMPLVRDRALARDVAACSERACWFAWSCSTCSSWVRLRSSPAGCRCAKQRTACVFAIRRPHRGCVAERAVSE